MKASVVADNKAGLKGDIPGLSPRMSKEGAFPAVMEGEKWWSHVSKTLLPTAPDPEPLNDRAPAPLRRNRYWVSSGNFDLPPPTVPALSGPYYKNRMCVLRHSCKWTSCSMTSPTPSVNVRLVTLIELDLLSKLPQISIH